MTAIEKNFVPYQIALEMKLLEFDEPCIGYFKGNKLSQTSWQYLESQEKVDYIFGTRGDSILAPVYSQAFEFFREKHNLHHNICFDIDEEYDKGFICIIKNKNKTILLENTESYKEAELDCLKKLIELIKL